MADVEDIYRTIAARIRQLREAGFTQQDLAEATGLSRPAVVNIETGANASWYTTSSPCRISSAYRVTCSFWTSRGSITAEQIAAAFDSYEKAPTMPVETNGTFLIDSALKV